MDSAMGSFLLVLLAFLSASTCVDCQQTCYFGPSLCYVAAGYSTTCRNYQCFSCENVAVGNNVVITIPRSDGVCDLACEGPTLVGNLQCTLLNRQYCSATTSVSVKKSDNSLVTMAGTCATCEEGYVVNDAMDGCVLNESSPPSPSVTIKLNPPPATASPPRFASPPPSASTPPSASPPPPPATSPPSASTPPSASPPPSATSPPSASPTLSGTPSGSPPEKSGGSSPPALAPSSSNEQKKKSVFPSYLKYVLSITIPAAAAGIIGLFFYCCQNRMLLAAERRKSPLARAVRSELKLKGVDDFKATLGLQYCTSIEMLAEALRTSGYIKAPALLGHDTRYLAAAMAAALRQRYESDVSNNQKGFLARFAHDCNDETSLGSLVFDVEEKIRANQGWSHRLAAPPKGSSATSANSTAALIPPPAAGIAVGIRPPHVRVEIAPPVMMPQAPPPQNAQPWTPSAPPFHHYPPGTATYPQNRQ